MPTSKTSAWMAGGQDRFFGTSLGAPGGGELPNSAMYWPGAAGWPSGDKANYDKHTTLIGRSPDAVRLYSTDISTTTGITGSAGPYGFIQPDWRLIANTNTILVITFKYNGTNWGTTADALNAAGSNSHKTAFANLATNLKRWHDDTGNTAVIKKIILGPHHEPSNDVGTTAGVNTAADYKRYSQAAFNFLRTQGVSDGPKPATGPGSAYTSTWYDMLEWCFVDIMANFGAGTPAATYAGNLYPGDGYCRWCFADGYNWAGGLAPNGGTASTHAKAGQVPQPGDTFTSGTNHYANHWRSMQYVGNNFHDWYAAGPGGERDVLLGFGEFATSEDVDRFTVAGTNLTAPSTHTGVPHMKGDWLEGVRKWLRGETWSAPNADNDVVAANLGFGSLIVMPIYWHSEALAPRWWNTIPYQTGDTTGPSTAGSGAHYTYDKYVTLATDTIFSASSSAHTAPTLGAIGAIRTPGGTGLDWTFSAAATAGDSAIVSYDFDPGDGTGATTVTTAAITASSDYTYTAAGSFTVTVTVTDTNGLTDVKTTNATPSITALAQTAFAGAPLIQQGDNPLDLRFTYNPAMTALEDYTNRGGGTLAVTTGGSSQTMGDPRAHRFFAITLTANITINLPVSPLVGETCRIVLTQNGAGNWTVTWAHGSAIKWPAATAPVQTVTASTSDEYEFICVAAGSWRGRRVVADVR